MIPLEAAAGSRACDGWVGEGLTRLSLSTSRIPNTLSTSRGNWGTWALFIPLRWMQKRLWSRLHRENHFFSLRSQLLLLRHHRRLMHPPLWVPSHEIPVRFLQSGEWLPTSVFWPGDFRGLYSPWGCKESDTTEWLSLHFLQGQAATGSPWPPPACCHPGPRHQQVQDRWRLASHKTKDSRQLIIRVYLKSLSFRSRDSANPAPCSARHRRHF